MRSSPMSWCSTVCKPPWKPLLAGLLAATTSCAAWSGAVPAVAPSGAAAPSDPTRTCQEDLLSMRRDISRYDSIAVPDLQVPEERVYKVSEIDASTLHVDQGRCVVACSGLYRGGEFLRLATQGPCRWEPGDWGRTMRFFGGCRQDRREMAEQIVQDGSISVVDEADPGGRPLWVVDVDRATVWTDDHACATTCTTPGRPDGMCRWNLFRWGDTVSFNPGPEVACLRDYHDIQQRLVSRDSIDVPDATDPAGAPHAVTRLIGMPLLAGSTCSAACAARGGLAAACTWTLRDWEQTIRYQTPPGDSRGLARSTPSR